MSDLMMGLDFIVDIPLERFDIDPYFDNDTSALGKSYVRHAA